MSMLLEQAGYLCVCDVKQKSWEETVGKEIEIGALTLWQWDNGMALTEGNPATPINI